MPRPLPPDGVPPLWHSRLTGASSRPLAAARRPAGGKPRSGGGGGAARKNAWLAADGSKRWGEAFFLLYTPFWLTLCLGIVVPFKLYERFTELEYLILGLVSTVPAFLIPLFLVGKADSVRSLKERYWVKVIICHVSLLMS
ncbi:hypothetical protein PR202_gb16020 [Eleusine coracana subsp. coracana]|uniref:Uncharacterized protein n=1 Tax=Eleusine coracana subsp. coracana TaxID=191504 RepID=A0AAV5F003_ELECO|nr:hypothetical protein PR202_gb16020 [Eleusine coracana subsp. coracana]